MFLSNWCKSRITNYNSASHAPIADWSQQELNNRSTTKVVTVSAGDTIQFYRGLWMQQRGANGAAYQFYYNPHELSYSVELVDSATGGRIALLDTTHYATTTSTRKPCFTTRYPMFSRVRTVVPAGYQQTRAFVRINTYATGTNPDVWVRVDTWGPYRSHKTLAKSSVLLYNYNVANSQDCSGAQTCDIAGIGYSDPCRINVSHADPITSTTMSIYSVYGSEVWSSSLPLASNPISVTVPNSGLYILAAKAGAQVNCSSLVWVP